MSFEIRRGERVASLLEVQMHPDPGFHYRLKLGPTEALQVFLEQQVDWINLEELS